RNVTGVQTCALPIFLLVMASAQLYSWALTSGGVPQAIAGALIEVSQSPIVILLMINVLLLFVGMFIEANAAIIILIPILFPVARSEERRVGKQGRAR